jgi:hypothetical protein
MKMKIKNKTSKYNTGNTVRFQILLLTLKLDRSLENREERLLARRRFLEREGDL